jgi:hypothetical protein
MMTGSSYPGPAIVKIIEGNWLICRHLRFFLMRIRVLFPQPWMAEDALYHVGFMNEADDFHLMGTPRTTKRVHFQDLFDELPPGF